MTPVMLIASHPTTCMPASIVGQRKERISSALTVLHFYCIRMNDIDPFENEYVETFIRKIHGIETLLLFSFRGWCAGSRVRLLDTKMRLKIDTVLEILFHDNDLAAVCQVLVPVFTFLWELSQCRRQGFYPLFQEVEVLVLLTEWCFDCHVLAFQILLSLAWAMLIFYTPRGGCGWRSSGLAACQEHGAICGKSKGFWMPQAERGIGSYIATAKGSDAREKLDLGHYYHHSSGVFLFSVLLIMGCFI